MAGVPVPQSRGSGTSEAKPGSKGGAGSWGCILRLRSLIILALLLVGGVLGSATTARANPISLTVNGSSSSTTAPVGTTVLVVASWQDEGSSPAMVLCSTAPNTIGSFASGASLTANNDTQSILSGTSTPAGCGSSITVTDDLDSLLETTTLSATFFCALAGTTQIYMIQNNVTSSPSITLTCAAVSSGPVAITASPNVVVCGGTSLLTAMLRDVNGAPIANVSFVFSTNSGLITQQSPTTALLTLLPGTGSATVVADTISPTGNSVSGSITVQNQCTTTAISVVANPNVIPCGGSTVITASARDPAGLLLPNLGYHFAADIGELIVGPPTSANAVQNVAVLKLQPGMKTATVKAWMDGFSDHPGQVTVQQFCRDVDATEQGLSTTAPGAIKLTPAASSLTCGQTTFVGALVRDANGQVVPDGTVVNFITDSGRLALVSGAAAATPTAGAPAPESKSVSATTVKGALNITYAPDPVYGTVSITAAAGTSFGSLNLTVTCGTGVSYTTPAGSTAPASVACTPIGDGVCIRPPNTGEGSVTIRPPNTGDAGLAAGRSD